MTNLEIWIAIKVGLRNAETILHFIDGDINRSISKLLHFKIVYYT